MCIRDSLEDVHTNVERELARRIGDEHAAYLHTARSRNDQVLLDMRLWERDVARAIAAEARGLAEVLIALGREHRADIMPGDVYKRQDRDLSARQLARRGIPPRLFAFICGLGASIGSWGDGSRGCAVRPSRRSAGYAVRRSAGPQYGR